MPLPLHAPSTPSAPSTLALRSAAAEAAEANEAGLLARVAAGELPAFEALYRNYHPRLSRFLGRMTRRPALVDELLDDTLMFVWQHAGRFNGRSKVSTWVFAVAYRKALKALAQLDEPVPDDDLPERAEPGPGPEQRLSQGQRLAALMQTLGRLSPEHRAVLALTYFHGMDYREIAEIADCPIDTVKTRMFHARRRLRALLPGGPRDWL